MVNFQIFLGDKIMSAYSEKKYEVVDIGIMHPEQVTTGYLYAVKAVIYRNNVIGHELISFIINIDMLDKWDMLFVA